MITMNLPYGMLVNLINFYAQAQIDLDRLVQDAHEWRCSWGYSIYSRMFKRKLFTQLLKSSN